MRYITCLGVGLLLVLSMAGSHHSSHAQDECPPGQWHVNGACTASGDIEWEEGWNSVLPGGETACAHGTPFRFWVRPGGEDLLVYFQGGGGCWSAETCRRDSPVFYYDQTAGAAEVFSYDKGIFDQDNPANPFRDYTTVFVPSCTGDVYTGTITRTYSDEVVIEHRGFLNLMSALDFTGETIATPESIFVTGCSAGSMGSIVAAPYLREMYPDVPLVQLGDSLGSLFSYRQDIDTYYGGSGMIPSWLEDAPSAQSFSLADFYIAVANHYPATQFAQFNYTFDHVQQRYFATDQDDPANVVRQILHGSLTDIENNTENFVSYTAFDDSHCIMPTNRFYQAEENGQRFVDWVQDLMEHEAPTIRCEECVP
jgi:hypothetical protein